MTVEGGAWALSGRAGLGSVGAPINVEDGVLDRDAGAVVVGDWEGGSERGCKGG